MRVRQAFAFVEKLIFRDGILYVGKMDTLSDSISLARALVRLSNAKKTGVLRVSGDKKRCEVVIKSGEPCAVTPVPGDDEMLGDLLLRRGKLDWSKHQQALIKGEAESPVGKWLIESGAAPRTAVESALLEQHRSRLRNLFLWIDLDYQFVEGSTEVGLPLVTDPEPIGQLIFDFFRQIISSDPTFQFDEDNRYIHWRITEIGKVLLRVVALSREESLIVTLLERGCRIDAVYREIVGSERAMLTLRTLRLLGAIVEKHDDLSPYSLLLRKRRQVRNSASPAALLDLPKGASLSQARKALRRLAWQLHPDRFGPDASPALHQASHQVMAALCSAENDLRQRDRNRFV